MRLRCYGEVLLAIALVAGSCLVLNRSNWLNKTDLESHRTPTELGTPTTRINRALLKSVTINGVPLKTSRLELLAAFGNPELKVNETWQLVDGTSVKFKNDLSSEVSGDDLMIAAVEVTHEKILRAFLGAPVDSSESCELFSLDDGCLVVFAHRSPRFILSSENQILTHRCIGTERPWPGLESTYK